jgi:chitin synthase
MELMQSFQYFLLSPTYVNTINIYAFCNVHDVSWGTREAETKKSLGSTKIGTGNEDNVDTEISAQDLDALYDAELEKFTTRAPEEVAPVLSEKAKNDYYDASFRSWVVLVWMFCNGALVALILRTGGIERISVQKQVQDGDASSIVKVYLTVVLWSVAGLSSFKFVGAMWYLIKRIVSVAIMNLCEDLLTIVI